MVFAGMGDEHKGMLKPEQMIRKLNDMVFSIQLVAHTKCGPGWAKPAKRHKSHSLWVVCRGRGTFIIDGNPYPAEPGKLFVIEPGNIFERISDDRDPLEYYFVRFTSAHAAERNGKWEFAETTEERFPLPAVHSLAAAPLVINLFEQLHFLQHRRGSIVAMRRKIIFCELLIAIARDFRDQAITGNSTMAIEQTIEHMVNHYNEKIDIPKLAAMAGLSPSHYSRLFRKYTGYSPIEYLLHLRMDRARELLILSDYKLRMIARSVGYQDEYYFSRLFKKIVGLSPTSYTERYSSKVTERPVSPQ